jgi:hypothetical protein
MRRISILLAVLAMVGVGSIPAASAVPPEQITITTAPGEFRSNIADCPTGTWVDELVGITGNFEKAILNIKVRKTLTCSTGHEFVIHFQPKVRGVPLPQSGPWRIVEGAIGGESLHGTGRMSLDFDKELDYPVEVFTGRVHIG